MPMERIKQSLSDLVHNWTYIAMITLFMFSVQPGPDFARALPAEQVKTEEQLKKEIKDKFSKDKYVASEMLTDQELKDLLWAVGFEGATLKTAWAIAKVESNGRPLAYNGDLRTGDKSYGIFQINMLGKLGVDRLEKFDLESNKKLFDPVTNAEIAYYMTKGGINWSAWDNSVPKAKVRVKAFPSNN
jgi:hypothetical protein